MQKVRRAEQKLSLPSTGTLIERVGRIQRTLAARSTTPTPRAKAEVRRASPARAARGSPPIWKQVEDIGGVLGLDQGGDAARVVAQAEARLSLPCTGTLVQRLARIQQHEAYVQLARPKQQPSPRRSAASSSPASGAGTRGSSPRVPRSGCCNPAGTSGSTKGIRVSRAPRRKKHGNRTIAFRVKVAAAFESRG